jgi:hypothetical protein
VTGKAPVLSPSGVLLLSAPASVPQPVTTTAASIKAAPRTTEGVGMSCSFEYQVRLT